MWYYIILTPQRRIRLPTRQWNWYSSIERRMRFAVFVMMTVSTKAFRSGPVWRRYSCQSSTALLSQRTKTILTRKGDFWDARMDVWRPTVNDVERISWGKPAKKKGTGSRGVPHRLNEEERGMYNRARQKGFLEVDGSGWRSQRREAPLINTHRSLCDARGQAAIVLHKNRGGNDSLVIDLSPLRNPEMFESIAAVCLGHQRDGEVVFQGSRGTAATDPEKTENDSNNAPETSSDVENPWESSPIYHLPPYCIVWELPRSEAKKVGKKFAELFDTAESQRGPSKKPVGVKPGKSRRSGGYGIG